MTAEEVQDLYYTALREAGDWKETSGQALVQKQMQLTAWEAVIAAVRKDYEQENERLREENRALTQTMLDMIERDAK